jgi:hypothetical protein
MPNNSELLAAMSANEEQSTIEFLYEQTYGTTELDPSECFGDGHYRTLPAESRYL